MTKTAIIEDLLLPLNSAYLQNHDSFIAEKIYDLIQNHLKDDEIQERANYLNRFSILNLFLGVISGICVGFVFNLFLPIPSNSTLAFIELIIIGLLVAHVVIDVLKFFQSRRDPDMSIYYVYRITRKKIESKRQLSNDLAIDSDLRRKYRV